MSKEILLVVESVSNEKGVEKEVIFEALELALASATKKRYAEEADVRVAIDRASGEHRAFRRWTIVVSEAEMEAPAAELSFAAAKEIDPSLELGSVYEEEIEPKSLLISVVGDPKRINLDKLKEFGPLTQFKPGQLFKR